MGKTSIKKLELVLLLAILLVGAFMRLYRISGYMTFLGDEGRDVLIVKRLLVEHHPPLIGPGTSIGNMYLGPLYYYMMAVPLLVANFSPVGPAVLIALLGVATILFVWWITREWFGPPAGGLIAAFLYAISPVIIIYSRSSWNPNIMPFFATLCIYSIWKVWQSREASRGVESWLIIVGIAFASVLQSHYLGLLLLPVIGIVWLLTLFKTKRKRKLLVYSFIGLFIFIILMSPLVIFDARHGWHNFGAIKDFFMARQTTVSIKPWTAIPGMLPILSNIVTDLVGAKNMNVGVFITGIILLAFVFVFFIKKEKFNEKKFSIILTLTMWMGFGLLGLGLYKQHIYDHYFGFVFTSPFIIFGGITQYIINRKNKIGYLIVGLIVLGIVFVDLQNSPLKYPPNNQLERTQVVAKKILEIANRDLPAGRQEFNFALIADSNYDSAYRYYLNEYNAKVVDIDPGNTKGTVTDNLLVVCEKEKLKCDPTHNPKTEISHFGMSTIEETWDNVYGVTIFRLGHSK